MGDVDPPVLHEYTNALDALPSFVAMDALQTVCAVPEVVSVLAVRLPPTLSPRHLVWVEPQVGEAVPRLDGIERVVVIAARPLARILPERKVWGDAPLGMQVGGLWRLRRELRKSGWGISAEYRFHTLQSILYNTISQRHPQPAKADRWHFAARAAYITQRPTVATLSLWICDHV